MVDYIGHGWPTSRKQCPNALKHYWTYRDELVQDQGIIMKGPKLLVPAVMRRKMLEKIHCSHVGTDSCLRKARDVLFWPAGAARIDGLQPSLKNVRQKIPPNGQSRLNFGFSYENFTTESCSVLPTPFRLNVS